MKGRKKKEKKETLGVYAYLLDEFLVEDSVMVLSAERLFQKRQQDRDNNAGLQRLPEDNKVD
jgi:hypothetical protein